MLLEFPDLSGQYIVHSGRPLTEVGDMAAYNFLNWWYIILGGQVGGEGIVLNQW